LDRSLELQSRYGERFSPPALLHQLAKNQTS
jgi:hypothetical protein